MFFFLYWCYIASLLCYSCVCLYYHACLHYLNKKWSDKNTDCTCCLKMVYIVEITRISAFHWYMTYMSWHDICSTIFFFSLCFFTLSPLGVGVPQAVHRILKEKEWVFLYFIYFLRWSQVMTEDMSFQVLLGNCQGFSLPDGGGKLIPPARNGEWKCSGEWFCASLRWQHEATHARSQTSDFLRGCRLL